MSISHNYVHIYMYIYNLPPLVSPSHPQLMVGRIERLSLIHENNLIQDSEAVSA